MKYFYWIIQNFLAPIMWVILKLRYNIKISGEENWLVLHSPLIIASNHKTLLDGFLISMSLPWGSRISPFRFMIESFRFKGPKLELLRKLGFITLFRVLVGGIPSNRGTGIENAIKIPLKILKKGGTVLMFPEGWLIREDSLGSFYHGTSALALASGAPIIPVFIKVNGRDVLVNIGKVFRLSPGTSRAEGTAQIREKILELTR